MTPAQIIAKHLAGLPHPDGGLLKLPGFNARILPEPIAQQVGKTAEQIGEAVVHLLKLNGYTIIKDEK